jgi:alkyl sulfatase BDS1-like metallo-beta-lactamase superfamily hydrolase
MTNPTVPPSTAGRRSEQAVINAACAYVAARQGDPDQVIAAHTALFAAVEALNAYQTRHPSRPVTVMIYSAPDTPSWGGGFYAGVASERDRIRRGGRPM